MTDFPTDCNRDYEVEGIVVYPDDNGEDNEEDDKNKIVVHNILSVPIGRHLKYTLSNKKMYLRMVENRGLMWNP
jgi:hypothetical protein